MTRLTVLIEETGSAFDKLPGKEYARMLRDVADRVEYLSCQKTAGGSILDANGNTSGVFTLTTEKEVSQSAERGD